MFLHASIGVTNITYVLTRVINKFKSERTCIRLSAVIIPKVFFFSTQNM